MKEEEEKNNEYQNLEVSNPELFSKSIGKSTVDQIEDEEKEKKNGCQFPSAYTILLTIELVVFILTFIIPKGQFYKIEYDEDKDIFTVKFQNGSIIEKPAEQYTLDDYNIKIPIESFKKGYIKKPLSIPDTYERIEGETTDFFNLLLYPIEGIIDSADIAIFLYILGGIINILLEMNALNAGIGALARITKGKEFLLIILVFVIISLCGSLFGSLEEMLPFYPILMPIFLKNNIDPMLAATPIYLGAILGNLFSTLNAFTVVIGSYSAGIPFINGVAFRIIALVLGDLISVFYMLYYHKKVRADEKKSVVYDIKNRVIKLFLKEENDKNKKDDENISNNNEEKPLIKKENEEKLINDEQEENQANKFTLVQKIGLISFLIGFTLMIVGVMAFDWWFEHMAALFLGFSILLVILLRKGEAKGIEVFIKGASDFVGVSMIIGLARGINITLDEGKIADTILDSLSSSIGGLNKILFALVMLIIFMILGIFISSSSGLAILAVPIFSPLADEVNCKRKIVINTFMYGQNFSCLITPTGIVLIALQMAGIPYNYWIKFIWPFMAIMFVYLVLLIITDVLVES